SRILSSAIRSRASILVPCIRSVLQRRIPRRAILVDPLHEIVERACGARSVLMIDDGGDDEASALAVDDVTGERAHAFQRTRLEQRLSRNRAILETPLDRAVGGRDGERR